ncbi:MAG: hypothetical protein WA891_09755 [Acidobacteriaceae bacterium]
MKSNFRTIALATLVVIASLSSTLHAQTLTTGVRVNVPFSFDYGSKHFGQGVYTLNRDGEHFLVLRGNSSVATAMIQAAWDRTPAKNSVVVFKKYGDRYFLDEISIAGAATHIDVLQSGDEKRATRELASRGENATQVALAFLPERSN